MSTKSNIRVGVNACTDSFTRDRSSSAAKAAATTAARDRGVERRGRSISRKNTQD